MKKGNKKDIKKSHICWDEDNLKKNEVIQKEVITEMRKKGQRISEPNTPYYHRSPERSPRDSLDLEENQDEKKDTTISNPEINSVEDINDVLQKTSWEDSDDEKKQGNDENFQQKRKKHYNEFLVMKEWKKKGILNQE